MVEVEGKGIGKSRVALIISVVIIVVLAVSSVWLYARMRNDYNSLLFEYNSLVSKYNSLVSKYNDYVAGHQFTNEQYLRAMFTYYYVVPAKQKFGVYDLSDDLQGLTWLRPYEEGVFDCSEMSAYLEWYLENEGWHTLIIVGHSPFGGNHHAWLLVETSTDHYMPVESTTIQVVWWDSPYFDNYFIYEHEFETIWDALTYSQTEFDWWNTT